MTDCKDNRGPLYPGLIYRQDTKYGAMFKGTMSPLFARYGEAEQWIHHEKEKEAQ